MELQTNDPRTECLLRDIEAWREPLTGGVSCEYLPVDYSCDNSIAFTAELCALAGKSGLIPEFDAFLYQFEKTPGCLLRHPTATETCSWDDHLAAAAMSPWMARRIYEYGQKNYWTWGGKFLGRFPILIPTVKASAQLPLTMIDVIMASGAYLANCFEGKEHTSGKISLWLASKALFGKSIIVDSMIRLWAKVQSRRYPGGLQEVMSIYFPPKAVAINGWASSGIQAIPHPFSVYSGKGFL